MNIPKESLGKAVRARRRELGLTLRQVANRAYISVGFLSEVELGKKDPSTYFLDLILKAVELQASEFYQRVAYEAWLIEDRTRISA